MKKFISTIAASVLCAAILSAQAFAADITEDRTVYAKNAQQIAAEVKDPIFDGGLRINTDTIIPIYSNALIELAKRGEGMILEIQDTPDWQEYIADLVDENGEFAGVVQFVYPYTDRSVHIYGPLYLSETEKSNVTSIDFRAHSQDVKSMLEKRGFGTDVKSVKLVCIDELGYLYYIDNGTEKVFVPAVTVKGGIAREFNDLFYSGDGEPRAVTMDEVRAAAWELDEYKKFAEKDPAPRSPSDGANPPVGGGENPPTMGVADENPPTMGAGDPDNVSRGDNPSTGSTGPAGAGVIALAACGLGFHFFRKKR